MKLFRQLLTTTACLLTTTSAHASVELTYRASQYQCGEDSSMVEISVDVYDNGELVAENMGINDSVMVSNIDDVVLVYSSLDANCSLDTPTERIVSQESEIPDLPGAYDQENIADLLAGLEDYEDLFLVELGTTDSTSFAYDLQDVVMVVNNDPSSEEVANVPDIILYAD